MLQNVRLCCPARFRMVMLLGLLTATVLPVRADDAKNPAKAELQFSESPVAGGPQDFITVRHLRIEGSQRAIGKKLAEIAKTRHRTALAKVDPVLLRARQEFFRRNYAMHFDRAAGVAEAFGLSPSQTEVDTMQLWFNMEPPAACSTVYYPGAFTDTGHPILSRNYDFTTGTFAELLGGKPPAGTRPMNADAYVIEMYPDNGLPSLYVCAYDLLSGAMDGINSAGLTIALLADHEAARGNDRLDTRQAGINQIELPRFILETCANVDEARAALMAAKQYYLFLPCHFIIGDAAGRSFIWEYGPGHNKEYATDGDGKPQVITNHSMYPYKSFREFPKSESAGSTYGRYIRMQKSIEKVAGKLALSDIKKTNDMVRCNDPAEGGPPERTLWHSIYDCTDRTLSVDFYLGEGKSGDQAERRSGYLTFRLER